MARDELLALAERVEAATGTDRALNAAIYQALNPHMRPIPNCDTSRFYDPAKTNHMTAAKYFLGGNATGVAKSYTSSFDAAMTLAKDDQRSELLNEAMEAVSINGWKRDEYLQELTRAFVAAALRAIAAQNDPSTTREHAKAGE